MLQTGEEGVVNCADFFLTISRLLDAARRAKGVIKDQNNIRTVASLQQRWLKSWFLGGHCLTVVQVLDLQQLGDGRRQGDQGHHQGPEEQQDSGQPIIKRVTINRTVISKQSRSEASWLMGGHCPDVVQVLDDVLDPPGRVQQPGYGLPGVHKGGHLQTD